MVLMDNKSLSKKLGEKYYAELKLERDYMQDELKKLIESFSIFDENNNSNNIEVLENEKNQAFQNLDIEKIKTLNLKIDNIKKMSDYVGTNS